MQQEEVANYVLIARDIIQHENVQKMQRYIQHGSVNCLQHTFVVSYYSYAWVKKMHLKCDAYALIRGALLHDYFLYDWHDHETWHRMHGFRHPGFALRNAKKDFQINEIEEEIIKKHMWPLTILPPMKKEAWIVTMVDKTSTVIEVLMEFPLFHRMKQRWFTSKVEILNAVLEDVGHD